MTLSIQSLKYHMIIWKLCGMWDWDGRPKLYPIYGAIITILFYIIFPLGIFVQLFFTTNVYESVQILCILFTSGCGFKLWLVMRQRPLLNRIFELMEILDLQITTTEFHAVIMVGVRRAQIVNIVGCLFNYVTSILLYIAKLIENDGTLIWPFYVPFNYRENAMIFHALLIYQFLGSMWAAMVHSTVDAVGGSMYSVLGAHLDVLGLRMSRLGANDHEYNEQYDGKRFKNCTNGKMERKKLQNFKDLKKCVDTHKLCVQ